VPRRRDSRTELLATMARLLRDQGYSATGLSQVLAESGVSNGSLYHHFPGGMEELAEAALDASGHVVAQALRRALENAPNAGAGLGRFLEATEALFTQQSCPGCPVAPTALESPIISPRLQAASARCFSTWETLIADRLRADGWPEDSVQAAASAGLALVEGGLLLARVSGQMAPLENARRAALTLLAVSPSQPRRSRRSTSS
jgi:TetR/AcrR family transcriptional regulator, lmrAB and yxaGH operons repressor